MRLGEACWLSEDVGLWSSGSETTAGYAEEPLGGSEIAHQHTHGLAHVYTHVPVHTLTEESKKCLSSVFLFVN